MRKRRASIQGFTLFEVILALMILGLLSGAVYSITAAALESTKATLTEQAASRRLEAFVRITRDAFLNLPADGKLFLRFGKASILSARPRADGTRVFSILRVPADLQGIDYDRLMDQGAWIPLLRGVEKVSWLFRQQGQWVEEWPEGGGRPESIRLRFDYIDLPGRVIDLQFWIPPLAVPEARPQTSPTPTPNPNAP